MAVIALALGQAAILTHGATIDHSGGEACQICVHNDRFDDVAHAVHFVLAAQPATATDITSVAPQPQGCRPAVVRARGSPTL